MEQKTINVELSEQELRIILSALGEIPLKAGINLALKIDTILKDMEKKDEK